MNTTNVILTGILLLIALIVGYIIRTVCSFNAKHDAVEFIYSITTGVIILGILLIAWDGCH
jgi:hypothetical protein